MAYTFDLSFQEYILASCIGDSTFLRGNLDAFKPEYFNDDILRGIADTVVDFWKRNKELPSKEAILHELKSTVAPGRHYSEYEDVIERVFEKVGHNAGYYQGKAVDFAKIQAVGNALKESVVLLESGDIDEIGRAISSALKVGSLLTDNQVYDYLQGTRSRALDYQKSKEADPNRLATGFYTLDEAMCGGLGLGELGIVVALPKSGKTTTLVNIAYAALMQNKIVNYFTLELSKKLIASKFDSRIFGKDLATMRKKPKSFLNALTTIKEQITGKLNIIEFPTKTMTISKMESVLSRIGESDVTIIDYGQLIKPQGRTEERRHQLTEVYEDLRRVAGELNTRIWTAHQANRPGFGSKTIQSNNIAEDFNIVGVADFLMSFNQTDEEKRIGKGRFYVMGSRIGDSGSTVPLNVDFRISSLAVDTAESESLE